MNYTTSFICIINGKTSAKCDEAQCVIGNFAATLYKYNFGYFCIGFLGIIIYISIFGGIKQNYRWFILNQAVWDLFKSFQFSCDNFLVTYFGAFPHSYLHCIYYFNGGSGPIDYTFRQFIVRNIYVPLVLLSITRFIALYYVNFYDKLTKGYRIIFTVLIFNLLFMIWDTEYLVANYRVQRNNWLLNECQIKQQQPSNSSNLCSVTNTQDFFSDILTNIYLICVKFGTLKPSICLLIASFSTSMIVLKVAKQAKFQLKHNRRDFFNSARVTIVITIQTLLNLFVFIFQFLGSIVSFVSLFTSNNSFIRTQTYLEGKNYTGYIDLRLPLWIDGYMGLSSEAGLQLITQIRIFIESIIVLSIMTGYREAIIKFCQKSYFFIRSPRKFFISFSKTSLKNSWT